MIYRRHGLLQIWAVGYHLASLAVLLMIGCGQVQTQPPKHRESSLPPAAMRDGEEDGRTAGPGGEGPKLAPMPSGGWRIVVETVLVKDRQVSGKDLTTLRLSGSFEGSVTIAAAASLLPDEFKVRSVHRMGYFDGGVLAIEDVGQGTDWGGLLGHLVVLERQRLQGHFEAYGRVVDASIRTGPAHLPHGWENKTGGTRSP